MKITVLTYLDSPDENFKDYDLVVPQVATILVKISPILIHIALTHSKQCSCHYENAQAETSTHVFPHRFGLQRLNP